jgi:hypothetical protein
MRSSTFPGVVCLLLLAAGLQSAHAQGDTVDSGEIHPLLHDNFFLGIGAFWPQKEFKLRTSGTIPGEEIDFDEVFRFDESETTGNLDFFWRFGGGRKWSLQANAWRVDSAGSAVLTEDIVWDDIIFREGSFVGAGVDLSVARVLLGRKFWGNDTYEVGFGLGLHWMEIGAFVEGEIRIDDESTDLQRGDAKAEFPLPNINFWYLQQLSPRWAFSTKVDWLSASVGDYSGGLWNVETGVHWQAFRHVGFSATLAYFELDGSVKDDDWRGDISLTQYGPRARVYVNF